MVVNQCRKNRKCAKESALERCQNTKHPEYIQVFFVGLRGSKCVNEETGFAENVWLGAVLLWKAQ